MTRLHWLNLPAIGRRRGNTALHRSLRRSTFTAALLLALSACGKGDQDSPGDDDDDATGTEDPNGTGEDTCIDNLEYFRDHVWAPVLSQKCQACHNPSGDAKSTDMVLVGSWWGPGYHEENFNKVEQLAKTEVNDLSVLLRKPTMDDIQHMGGMQLEKDSSAYEALATFVERVNNPDKYQCPDNGTANLDKAFAKIDRATPQQTLRKALILLNGRLPTQAELDAVAGDDIQKLDPVLDAVLQEEAFYSRLEEVFNDYFLTDRYLPYNSAIDLLDDELYPDAYWVEELEDGDEKNRARRYTNEGIAREALHLVAHVVRNHRPFTEILTAGYTLVNPFSAKAYGLTPPFADPQNPNEWVEVQLPGIPHSGVLTSYMMMNRLPTTATNRNRHRARKIFEFFLATDVEALASRPLDPTKITDHNPTLNNPSCLICHSSIDPVAGALQNWDDRGRFRPPAEGWFPDMPPPAFGKNVMPAEAKTNGTRWLADQIIADRRYPVSMVHLIYRGLLGQRPLIEPTDTAAVDYVAKQKAYRLQEEVLNNVAKAFVASNYEVRTIVKELVKTPYFRAIGANAELSADEQAVFAELGTARFLTPEILSRKIAAITGYPWRPRPDDTDFLLEEYWYRIFYGGIDSDSITQRITEPNGIMNNVAARMSNEMACWTSARDFALPKSQRLLFPYVETTIEPEDANEFEIPGAVADIKQNIVHLHQRVLGETVAIDSPQVNNAFSLFLDVWKTGKKEVEAETQERYLSWECQARTDFWTGQELPEEQRIEQDPNYTVRAWMAVMSYLLSDFRFLHE